MLDESGEIGTATATRPAQIETGAEHDMWTFQRYQTWLESKKTWHFPGAEPSESPSEPEGRVQLVSPPASPAKNKSTSTGRPPKASPSPPREGGAIEIEPVEGGLGEVLKKLAD